MSNFLLIRHSMGINMILLILSSMLEDLSKTKLMMLIDHSKTIDNISKVTTSILKSTIKVSDPFHDNNIF